MDMKITCNVATYPPREHSLKMMVASIYDQADVVRICFNEYDYDSVPEFFKELDKVEVWIPNSNKTDNGKFAKLDTLEEPEYYFTMDDDIIYPPDYVEKTIANIKKYGMIITYHGRVLKGTGKNYYYDHESYRCLGEQKKDVKLDVCGTGVTAFDTRYFHPKGLANHKHQRMSDMIFSLEAAKQGKKIGSCSRKVGWIKAMIQEENIFDTESKGGTPIQNKIADQIFKLNHGE